MTSLPELTPELLNELWSDVPHVGGDVGVRAFFVVAGRLAKLCGTSLHVDKSFVWSAMRHCEGCGGHNGAGVRLSLVLGPGDSDPRSLHPLRNLLHVVHEYGVANDHLPWFWDEHVGLDIQRLDSSEPGPETLDSLEASAWEALVLNLIHAVPPAPEPIHLKILDSLLGPDYHRPCGVKPYLSDPQGALDSPLAQRVVHPAIEQRLLDAMRKAGLEVSTLQEERTARRQKDLDYEASPEGQANRRMNDELGRAMRGEPSHDD